jgi:hypothetical protein
MLCTGRRKTGQILKAVAAMVVMATRRTQNQKAMVVMATRRTQNQKAMVVMATRRTAIWAWARYLKKE